MSPLRRRSARLQGSNGTPGKPTKVPSHRLSNLVEQDESPLRGPQTTLDAIVSSPMHPRTPATVGRIKPAFEEMHPGNTHSTSSPSFDFRFSRPAPKLGPQAQTMMDELREEALRIKVKLAAERELQKQSAALEEFSAAEGRKFALPKGKVGRFSDVHIAQFKKMDSIAGHASAFRAQPGRSTNTPACLKRSQSRAKLDDPDNSTQGTEEAGLTETFLPDTPAKRARVATNQDNSQSSTPTLSRSRSVLASLTTPTKASLARSASVKQPTKIPTISHSPSKHNLTGPRPMSKSFTMNNIAGVIRPKAYTPQTTFRTLSKLDRLKSMLGRPIANSEKLAPILKTSGTSTRVANKPNLDKELPSVPTTPVTGPSHNTKHVKFTPETLPKNATVVQHSPSPLRSGIPRSKSTMTMRAVQYPSLQIVKDDNSSEEVHYPPLPPSHVLPHTVSAPIAKAVHTSAPGTFTFRSDKTIDFGASPRGFGPSAGQASVRQVRESILQAPMPGTFPNSNKENIGGVTAIPQGLANKKRRRVDSDDEKGDDEMEASPAKKRKGPIANLTSLMVPKLQAEKLAAKSRIPSPSKKAVLSLNRLNMLARPKMRK